MVTFSFERGTSFIADMVETVRRLGDLIDVARQVPRPGGTAWDDQGLRREIGHLAAEMDALWAMIRRNISQAQRHGVPGVGGSVTKLYYSEMLQRMADLAMRIFQRAGLAREDLEGLDVGQHTEERLRSLSFTIAAGTSQIQRNIIAERILGLPKEPR
jgi:alkylation response protein AidB-like acyl-CoA dehydrogenase